MKRIKLLNILLVGLCLTGCSKGKKIECAYYEQNSDVKMNYDYMLNYDDSGNTLKTLELTSSIEFNNKEDLDTFIGQADNNVCDYVKNTMDVTNNLKCDFKEQDNKISITLTYDYDKLTEDEKNNLMGSYTFDEFKDLYESNDYEQDFCVFNSNKKIEPVLKNNGSLDFLNKSNTSAAEDSAYGVLQAAETYVVTYMLNHHGDQLNSGTQFKCGKNANNSNKLECYIDETTLAAGTQLSATDKKALSFKGTIPTEGTIELNEEGVATIVDSKPLKIDNFYCNDGIEEDKSIVKCSTTKSDVTIGS